MRTREIKFRVWSVTDRMMRSHEWLSAAQVVYSALTRERVDIHVMQYTGLKDKNGKEIYEGDLLRLNDGGDVSHHKIYWEHKEGRWFDQRLEDGDSQTAYDSFDFVTECTVIGNIYENPELLKP